VKRIIRERGLFDFVGLKRTAVADLIEKGEFPKPIPLIDGGRSKGWWEDELSAWQQWRLAIRDGTAKEGSGWRDFLPKPAPKKAKKEGK
jgi:predicted DNA-binding transcriptional regulator AlpA